LDLREIGIVIFETSEDDDDDDDSYIIFLVLSRTLFLFVRPKCRVYHSTATVDFASVFVYEVLNVNANFETVA
jgi:hypothetical protein